MVTHWKWFGEWSIGCIGILSDWIVETAATLCRTGETTLTLEALAKHALKPAQRLKLETEARTGEFKIEEAKKESERELQRLLGKPSTIPVSSLPHLPLSVSATTPLLPEHAHASSRIERASYRDPVGEQVVTTTSTKCSYLGEISVTRRQFYERKTKSEPEPSILRNVIVGGSNLVIRGNIIAFLGAVFFTTYFFFVDHDHQKYDGSGMWSVIGIEHITIVFWLALITLLFGNWQHVHPELPKDSEMIDTLRPAPLQLTRDTTVVEIARLVNKAYLLIQALGGLLPGLKPESMQHMTSVLDVACGPGIWTLELARGSSQRYPWLV